MKKWTFLLALTCFSSCAIAGGYRVALQGNNATGMGHAGVAMSENAEAVFFNPSAMSLLDKTYDVSVGTILIDSTIKYQNRDTNTAEETDNPLGTPAYLYFTGKYNEKLAYGLGIYTPYGNTVQWGDDWAGSHVVENIRLFTIYVQPSVSYRINDMISIGGGPIYAHGSVEFTRNISSSLVDGSNQRSSVTLNANGVAAWGYSAGMLIQPMSKFSIGLNYRSRIDLEARNGAAEFENTPTTLADSFSDTTFEADLVLPAELTFGVAYKIMPKTIFAADINRVFWSAYESLDIKFVNTGTESLSPRNYEDANVYRIGLQHQLFHNVIIRAGMYYDDSPVQETYYSPESPRNNSVGYTVGASYALQKNLLVDVSFLYLTFDAFNGSYDYVGHDDDPNTKDSAFGGEYLSSVGAFGLGLNYKY